jgi:hypothetical protein
MPRGNWLGWRLSRGNPYGSLMPYLCADLPDLAGQPIHFGFYALQLRHNKIGAVCKRSRANGQSHARRAR